MKIPFVFKKCSKCGRWLVASKVNFNKDKSKKYGLTSWCKECRNVKGKKYYMDNKEKIAKRDKKYYKENKEKIAKRSKNYYEENKEYYVEYYKQYYQENKEDILNHAKKYYKTPQGQVVTFNGNTKRRQREEQQGNGITPDQWLEMMKFFDWKCAYSGKSINVKENRSIDHIVPLAKDGAHEIWNCVPMYRPYNIRKQDKNLEEWYLQQDFYDEDRVNKINEWREYAYNKWSNDEIQKTI